jgi:hypothetical protein
MAVSDDTILRLLKRPTSEPRAPEGLHIVGIDHCAWLKGQHNAQAPNEEPRTPPQAAGKSSIAAADHMFVMDPAMDGMTEVELGKLAREKASNPKVKAFGHRMVTDHGKARRIEGPRGLDADDTADDGRSRAQGHA